MNKGILSIFGVAIFFAILFGGLTFESVMAAPAEKVDVCHVDPDNDGAGLETINIKNNKSVEKHVAHGDHVGACFVCGDGFTDGPTETCDDGNTVTEVCGYDEPSCTVCASDCTEQSGAISFCGDNATNGPEECDDGANVDGDGCTDLCILEVCGDGTVNNSGAEECDDTGESATCDANCSVADCGDGTLNLTAGEKCDDSNNLVYDGCSDICEIEELQRVGECTCEDNTKIAAFCIEEDTPSCDDQCVTETGGRAIIIAGYTGFGFCDLLQ